jgi:hypothetical protein
MSHVPLHRYGYTVIYSLVQLFGTVAREYGTNLIATGQIPDEVGYVNQHGLSRKVRLSNILALFFSKAMFSAYF